MDNEGKIFTTFHKRLMINDCLNLKQSTRMSNYYAEYGDMKPKCAIIEEQWITLTRFINGL